MHSLLIKKEKQSSKKRVKKVVLTAKALEEKDLDCAIKLNENNENNKKIKNIKKLNKNMIKLLKTSHATKIERVKDQSAMLISSLSSAVTEERNRRTACVELCEKKIEENKKQHECEIVKLKCDHDTEIVSLKNNLKVHEEKRDRMEWIFRQRTKDLFLKNLNSNKNNIINFLDQVSKQLAAVSLEDLSKYFLQTQSIIQQLAMLQMEAEERNEDLQQISSDQTQQLADMKERLDNAIDTILDQQQQNKETPV